ncbi:MAG: YkgJ family cysteine cluster protein [Bacteroidia bacterium]
MDQTFNHIAPNEVFKAARAKQSENIFFKKELKKYSSELIDEKVQALVLHFYQLIDCTKCANCCKNLEPGIEDHELEKLAERYHMDVIEFRRNYVEFDGDTLFLKTKPCMFLDENKCGIYEDRPHACALYPHLEQSHFKYKKNVWSNYQICPIVYEVVEGLKKELNFEMKNKESESSS